MLYSSVLGIIGKTPTVELSRMKKRLGFGADVFAKLEMFSPTGSVKDRIALSMIEDAERTGRLRRGGVIIEPTSGNTGIGLAAVGAVKGYRVIAVMPESMSAERRKLIRAYGAELELTPAGLGMQGAVARAEELAAEYKNSFIPSQFTNPANPMTHYMTTAGELWADMEGKIDAFVAGVGTGGTLTGVGKFLKEKNPSVHIVAVEPMSSPVLSKGERGSHKIQGIGAGFVPKTLDTAVYDEIAAVPDAEAFETARMLAVTEGLFCGISSGAALAAALALAARDEFSARRIAVLLPDNGLRYLSTELTDNMD